MTFVFWIVIWFLTSALVSAWSLRWGRGSIGTFFVCIIFSPLIGAIVVLLAGKKGKKCPFCKSKIDTNAIVCPKCQRDQPIENTVDQKQKTDTPTPPTIS